MVATTWARRSRRDWAWPCSARSSATSRTGRRRRGRPARRGFPGPGRRRGRRARGRDRGRPGRGRRRRGGRPRRVELDDGGDEQGLAGDGALGQLRLHALHDEAFVGGVLVDDDDAVAGLGHDVGFVHLGPGGAQREVEGVDDLGRGASGFRQGRAGVVVAFVAGGGLGQTRQRVGQGRGPGLGPVLGPVMGGRRVGLGSARKLPEGGARDGGEAPGGRRPARACERARSKPAAAGPGIRESRTSVLAGMGRSTSHHAGVRARDSRAATAVTVARQTVRRGGRAARP
jgi:hypothetical protein